MTDRAHVRKLLDERLASWREAARKAPPPPRGWLRALRDAAGMSQADVARRMGLSRARVAQIERGEVDGSTTISALRRAAEAMDSSFVYAFVPNESVESLVQRQAEQAARRDVDRATHTMLLEDQNEPEDAKRLVEQIAEELSDSRDLWRR